MSEWEGARRPGSVRRWLFRAPVLMYRVGLGGLMPAQVMLTTVGRKSGRPHRAVVDLLKHDAATNTWYVTSGYGAHSDWYRNLQANPEVQVQVRCRRFRARTTVLSEKEAEGLVLGRWRGRGRLYRLYLDWSLRLVGLKGRSEEEVRAAAAEMRLVAIRPEASP